MKILDDKIQKLEEYLKIESKRVGDSFRGKNYLRNAREWLGFLNKVKEEVESMGEE